MTVKMSVLTQSYYLIFTLFIRRNRKKIRRKKNLRKNYKSPSVYILKWFPFSMLLHSLKKNTRKLTKEEIERRDNISMSNIKSKG